MDERSRYLRGLCIDALEGGGRGHVGSTLSLIEIFRVLYDDVLLFDAADPRKPDRDRVILSKGHGCIAQYVLLADKGFFPVDDLRTFCHFDSHLGGHPEYGHTPGVEASTGALGHGLAIGTGMAFAARITETPYHVFVVVGDGELNEGSIWESALAASHHALSNLTVIIDHNKFQASGPLEEVWRIDPLAGKWESFGFTVVEVDGHDVSALREALRPRPERSGPTAVIADTVKGKGIPFAEGSAAWHHKAKISAEDVLALREANANA